MQDVRMQESGSSPYKINYDMINEQYGENTSGKRHFKPSTFQYNDDYNRRGRGHSDWY